MKAYQKSSAITGYHAHVYFDAHATEKAKEICQDASELFSVTMGNVHERPVGPHPMYSCQLTCNPTQFFELLPWLALNREELIVFCHPETGDDLADHSKHVIWLGEAQALDLAIFRKETTQ